MPIILQNMRDLRYIDYGALVGAEYDSYRHRVTPLQEPRFVGFECLACGGRHAGLLELMDCHEAKRKGEKRA